MAKAFCPEKTVQFNPIIDICRHIVFREKSDFAVERPQKFGGKIQFGSFDELATAYTEGKLHPMDLKNGVAEELGKILEPVKSYFENNKEAKECLEAIRKAKITR
jgi:tyrosyl-tRNA synthetase